MFKVFITELFIMLKERSLSVSQIKCLIFYLITGLAGYLIKDQAEQEVFYEVVSEISAQEGLF